MMWAPPSAAPRRKTKGWRRVHLRAAQRVLLKGRAAEEKARRADDRWLERTGRKAEAGMRGCS